MSSKFSKKICGVAFRSAKVALEPYFRGEAVILLAVLALATVAPMPVTGANAQTANVVGRALYKITA